MNNKLLMMNVPAASKHIILSSQQTFQQQFERLFVHVE